MSVLDQFRDAEQRVAQRLKELEPAVTEYRELEAVAQRLGIEAPSTEKPRVGSAPGRGRRRAAPAPGKPTAGRAKAAPAAKRSRRSSRGTPGQREQQLVELVRGRPGITVAEAGRELGVDPTGLYRVVRRLEQRGEVRKTGRGLDPVQARSAD